MSERFDQFEVQREVSALLDGLPEGEQRQVMAALAERFNLKISEKPSAGGRAYRPGAGRRRSIS